MFSVLFTLFVLMANADPTPNGGKPCNYTSECSGGGICDWKNVQGIDQYVCACYPQYGNYDCSYKRSDRVMAGCLQIVFSFVGIFGIGNYIIGDIPKAVAQSVLGLFYLTAVIIIPCLIFCGMLGGNEGFLVNKKTATIISCIVRILLVLFGLGWSIYNGVEILQGLIIDANGYKLY
jgi:hypothetical protein